MVFHWSLSDSKSPQVSRTRLRILAVLSNDVVWIVSTRPPVSPSEQFHLVLSHWSLSDIKFFQVSRIRNEKSNLSS